MLQPMLAVLVVLRYKVGLELTRRFALLVVVWLYKTAALTASFGAVPAGKYREFHRLYEEDNRAEAAALLVTLMTSQLAPK